MEEEVCSIPKPEEILAVQKQGRYSRGSSKPGSGILILLWQFSLKIHHKSGSDSPLKLYSISTIRISSILPRPLHWGGDFAVTISQGHHLLPPQDGAAALLIFVIWQCSSESCVSLLWCLSGDVWCLMISLLDVSQIRKLCFSVFLFLVWFPYSHYCAQSLSLDLALALKCCLSA